MRAKKTCFLIVVLACLFFVPVGVAQPPGYFSQMGQTFTRGVKNIVSFPWEIPVTIKEHDQLENGNPRFFRDTAGFFDGTFRAVTRLGCGVWDVLFSWVPGDQDGLPLQPKAFF